MKKKEFRGKLKLNKKTISNLNNGNMNAVYGGGLPPTFRPVTCCCPTTKPETCDTCDTCTCDETCSCSVYITHCIGCF
jgi:hypothetical protein